MLYREPPEYMLRMRAVTRDLPGAFVMDTGAAVVLGILGDPQVARAADAGAILVNIGNMHTFGVALRGRRVFGLFEHHTGGITPAILRQLVDRLRAGTLTHQEVLDFGGHGAAFVPDYALAGPFDFVAITGPNRGVADELGYHQGCAARRHDAGRPLRAGRGPPCGSWRTRATPCRYRRGGGALVPFPPALMRLMTRRMRCVMLRLAVSLDAAWAGARRHGNE